MRDLDVTYNRETGNILVQRDIVEPNGAGGTTSFVVRADEVENFVKQIHRLDAKHRISADAKLIAKRKAQAKNPPKRKPSNTL